MSVLPWFIKDRIAKDPSGVEARAWEKVGDRYRRMRLVFVASLAGELRESGFSEEAKHLEEICEKLPRNHGNGSVIAFCRCYESVLKFARTCEIIGFGMVASDELDHC